MVNSKLNRLAKVNTDVSWVFRTVKTAGISALFLFLNSWPLNITAVKKSPKLDRTEHGEYEMKISEEGKALIKKFEGCELTAYQDAVDVWTIGYGHTKKVCKGDCITQEDADKMLEEELTEYEGYVNDMVTVDLQQNEFDSLVAWTYNLGPSNLKSSTMLKEINAKNFARVPSEMRRWNKAGGKTLDGLIRRREAESLLFMNEPWHEI